VRWGVALLAIGCGARVAPDAIVDDAAVDTYVIDTGTRVDTYVAPAPDTTPAIDTRPPDPVGCTATEPKPGDRCAKIGERCAWNSACGGVNRGVCTATGWSIEKGLCPPATAGCPATRPAKGAACPFSTEVCLYGNACGAVVAAQCSSSGMWSVTEFPCRPGCPWAAPAIGSSCKLADDIKTCDYTFGPTCSFACLCYLDRWTCYGTPCTDPPVGSGLED
jgi:hypothetical protein